MNTDGALRYRCPEHVHARRFDDELVILDLAKGEYFALNGVGSTIWEELTRGKSVGEAVEKILVVYAVDSQAVWRDAVTIISELVAAGLLVPLADS